MGYISFYKVLQNCGILFVYLVKGQRCVLISKNWAKFENTIPIFVLGI